MSHEKFESVLYQWFDEQKECDVKFACPDPDDCSGMSIIGAHKVILSVSSDVFYAMLYGSLTQNSDASNKNVIDIPDIQISIFKMLLRFIYLKTIQFENIETASEFYYAAEKYNCTDALKFVLNHMLNETNPKYCIFIYETNFLYNNDQLKNSCLKTFSEACDEIIASDEFLSADIKTIETIFGMESLAIQSEVDLIKALERYIESNKVNDPEILVNVRPAINLIRFLTLKWNDLVATSLLTSDEKLQVASCLSPQEDLTKMPPGLSICKKKRHFVKAVCQMIRELSDVYSSKTCYRCVCSHQSPNSCCHPIWNCEHHAGTNSKSLSLIFQKYNHTSLMEYDRSDLQAVYDIFKKWRFVK